MGKDRIIWVTDINSHLIWDEAKLLDLHPIDSMEQIDKAIAIIDKCIEGLEKNTEELSIFKRQQRIIALEEEFTKWSGNFNRALRKKIKSFKLDKEMEGLSRRYANVYAYWWNRFQYIERKLILLWRRKNTIEDKEKRDSRENSRQALCELIKNENPTKEKVKSAEKIINEILGGTEKNIGLKNYF